MYAAVLAAWAAAAVLAGLHVLEHRRAASAHAARWRAMPRGLRAGLMLIFFSFALVAVSSWFLFPVVTLTLLALADLAGAVHLIRHWRPSS